MEKAVRARELAFRWVDICGEQKKEWFWQPISLPNAVNWPLKKKYRAR